MDNTEQVGRSRNKDEILSIVAMKKNAKNPISKGSWEAYQVKKPSKRS